MDWLESLRGRLVGLDTAPLIYFIEENDRYARIVQPFFEAVHHGEFQVVTSVITLLEVLVQPLRAGNEGLAGQYRDLLLHSENLITSVLTPEIAEEAARLRASHSIRTPDAIQIAVALKKGARCFLTNDRRLASIEELEILVIDDLVNL